MSAIHNFIQASMCYSSLQMSGRGKKVRVWVRTRPTANFAHNMIDLQSDGKVIHAGHPQ